MKPVRFEVSTTGNNLHMTKIGHEVNSLKPGIYDLEIKQVRQTRSLAQNRYFHGVVVPAIAEYMGSVFDGMPEYAINGGLEEAKEAIKSKYLPKTIVKNKLDKRRKIVRQIGTSDLDTAEFKDFIDTIVKDFPWIPLPDSGDALKFYDMMIGRYGSK